MIVLLTVNVAFKKNCLIPIPSFELFSFSSLRRDSKRRLLTFSFSFYASQPSYWFSGQSYLQSCWSKFEFKISAPTTDNDHSCLIFYQKTWKCVLFCVFEVAFQQQIACQFRNWLVILVSLFSYSLLRINPLNTEISVYSYDSLNECSPTIFLSIHFILLCYEHWTELAMVI